MKSSKSKTISHAIIVYPEHLAGIDAFLRKEFVFVNYDVSCSDNTEFQTYNMQEVLEYENPNFRRIKTLKISGSGLRSIIPPTEIEKYKERSFDPNQVSIRFGDQNSPLLFTSSNGGVSYTFEDSNQLFPIEDELTKRIKDMRPWYYFLTRIPLVTAIFALLALVTFGGSILYTLLRFFDAIQPIPPSAKIGESAVYDIGLFALLLIAAYLIDRARMYFLLDCFFCIGKQEQSYQKRQRAAKYLAELVIVVIGVGLLVNLIASAIWSGMSK
jgi:hypothetical protein